MKNEKSYESLNREVTSPPLLIMIDLRKLKSLLDINQNVIFFYISAITYLNFLNHSISIETNGIVSFHSFDISYQITSFNFITHFKGGFATVFSEIELTLQWRTDRLTCTT